jgi:Ca2+-binding RTX toxin-like protein
LQNILVLGAGAPQRNSLSQVTSISADARAGNHRFFIDPLLTIGETILGDAGNDNLLGVDGNDYLYGGLGNEASGKNRFTCRSL